MREKVCLAILPPILSSTLKAIGCTCTFESGTRPLFESALREKGRVCLALWHETLAIAAYYFRNTGYHTLTSHSYDGELAARVLRGMGLFALRGSSSRGGSEAVHDMTEAFRHVEVVGLTLDGPRGPRHVAKPGVGILAGRARASIVPVAFHASRAWRLNSWDRTLVPKPFAKVIVAFGPAMAPPVDDTREEVERVRADVETRLNAMHDKLDQLPV